MVRVHEGLHNLELLLQDGRHSSYHSIPDQFWFPSQITTFGQNIFNLIQPYWHDDGIMSWRRQFTPAILRHVVPSLSGGRAALSLATILSGARYTSQFSPASPNLGGFDVKDMLGKALDFKGSLPEHKSPADMWADKSNNLKLPPPPDTWTGMSVGASTA